MGENNYEDFPILKKKKSLDIYYFMIYWPSRNYLEATSPVIRFEADLVLLIPQHCYDY